MGRNVLLVIRRKFRVLRVKGVFSDHRGLAPSGALRKADGEARRGVSCQGV